MASLKEFETTLKEVVKAKRVSASKMTSLTELALKSMDNDTQLVSILYRTHKSLPTAAKVSSLYAFDSLARAARSKVTKHNITGDLNSEKGNCATFLLKVEGVLDGLFQDMIATGNPESKEKSKKILDIWTKSNTFPSAVLTRLRDLVKDAEKESNKVVTTAIADPRTVNQSPVATITTPTPPPPPPASATILSSAAVESTLLALLSQAANAGALNSQTPPNTGVSQPAQPQLDPAQFALLQQLAQTAKLGNGQHISSPVQSLPPSARPGPTGGFGGPSHPHPPYRDDRYGSGRGDPRYGRHDNQGRGRGRGDYHEDRSGYRGSYRGGGGFRGRGRGGYDDRDHLGEREGYRSPPPRPRRSRSQSPPSRYGGGVRRDVKPYSPPQRPTMAPLPTSMPDRQASSHSADSMRVASIAIGGQRDEFGRDIRPQSPGEAVTEEPAQQLSVPASVEQSKAAPAIAGNQISSVPQQTPSAAAANTSTQIHSAPAAVTSQPGLDKFDMSIFDFTASSSWEALGKMWQVTYGYLPSQEELMQFVTSGGVIASAAAAGMIPGQYQAGMVGMEQGWPQPGAGQWTGQGGGAMGGGYLNRGGGPGYGNGNTRNNQQQRGGYKGMGYQQDSDAIVLGGGDVSSDSEAMQVESPPPTAQASPPSGEGGPGGRMQRDGDKWVFVRDTATS